MSTWNTPFEPSEGGYKTKKFSIDGKYLAQVVDSGIKWTKDAKPIYRALVRIADGHYAGEEAEVTFYDYVGNQGAGDALKNVMFKIDPTILNCSGWDESIDKVDALIKGSVWEVEQATKGSYTNVYLNKLQAAHVTQSQTQTQVQPVQQAVAGNAPF